MRRELLDQVLFWNASDLELKLGEFQGFYNEQRVHASLKSTPAEISQDSMAKKHAVLEDYRWQSHCRGLFSLPIAA